MPVQLLLLRGVKVESIGLVLFECFCVLISFVILWFYYFNVLIWYMM